MVTNRQAHEDAAGMNLSDSFFIMNNIDPNADIQAEEIGMPSRQDRIIITRSELIHLLVDAYLTGIDTAKEVMARLKPDHAQIIKQFEDKFGSIESEE